MDSSEILRKASEYIAEHGHHKESFTKPDGTLTPPACAMGAITIACNGQGWLSQDVCTLIEESRTQLAQHLIREGQSGAGEPFQVIAVWNDYKRTSAEDVILALKRAADE